MVKIPGLDDLKKMGVKVEDAKTGFKFARQETPEVWGIGRKVRYVFEKGDWKAKDPNE